MSDPEAFFIQNQKRGDIPYFGGTSTRDWRVLSNNAAAIGSVLSVQTPGGPPVYDYPASLRTTAYFKSYRSGAAGAQAVPGTGVFTTLVFDAEDADPSNIHNATTGVFTVPFTGNYQINASADVLTAAGDAAGTIYAVGIFVNGAERVRLGGEFSTWVAGFVGFYSFGGGTMERLTAADTVDVRAFQNSGANRNFMNAGRLGSFSAHFLSV